MNNKENEDSQNQNEEVDIIVLFEYFRKGFLSIIQFIEKLIRLLLLGIIGLLIHLKKNILLISAFIVLGIVGYFLKLNLIDKNKFHYEMVVLPQDYLTNDLYNSIYNLNIQNKKAGKEVFINVEAVKDEQEIFKSYTKNKANLTNNELFDSIYMTDIPFKNYINQFDSKNFSKHKITVDSKKELDATSFQNKILQSINTNKALESLKEIKVASLERKKKLLEKNLNNIDTLLHSIAQNSNRIKEANELVLSGNGKSNNLETELIKESNGIINQIAKLDLDINESQEFISVFSNLKRIDPPKKIVNGLLDFIILGFLGGLLASFLLILNKYLNQYEKQKKS